MTKPKSKPGFILIVEDELLVAHSMKKMLIQTEYNEVKIAGTLPLAQSLLVKEDVKVAILDINLGKGDEGLILAKQANELGVPFFFLSSYSDKPTLDKALETMPGAYLIKPFVPSNLYTALNITLNSKPQPKESFLSIKESNQIKKIKTEGITYINSDNVYVVIHTTNRKFLQRTTLSKILENLPSQLFIQVHRSYVVNINHITKISSQTIEVAGKEIPISRTYKNILKNRLEKN
jgi:DNA-binding LytR/AlgR family response regulator